MTELKKTLIETGNPFVWISELGWFFNEQPNSVKYSAEDVLNAVSFEALANPVPKVMGKPEEVKTETKEPETIKKLKKK